MSEQFAAEKGWAVATGINARTKRRYLHTDTVRRTRRQAIAAYVKGSNKDWTWFRRNYDSVAVRVTILATPSAPEGAGEE